jgi:protein TonB
MFGRSTWITLAAVVCLPSLTLAQQSTLPSPDDPSFVQGAPYGPEHIPRMKLSGDIMEKDLLQKVPPEYPAQALAAKIGGTVVFAALLGRDGSVKQVNAISGQPELIDAATLAVKQWKYKPWKLDGKGVEVETTISVKFDPEDPGGAGIISPQLRADIEQLFHTMRGKDPAEIAFRESFNELDSRIGGAIPRTSPNREEMFKASEREFVNIMRLPAFKDAAVAIYAKHFTDDEIKAIDQFFQTPAGQHFARESSELNAESAALGRKVAADHIPGVLANLCKEFPELQHDASLCQSSSSSSDGQLITPSGPNVPSTNTAIAPGK